MISRMTLLSNKHVQELAETFDLDLPTHYLEIAEYEELDGCIVIYKINVLDAKDNFVKLANLSAVVDHLSNYPVRFKEQ